MNNDWISGRGGGRKGSIYPKEREKVLTKAVKKIAENLGKVGKSVSDAANNHKNKSKVLPC
ncbi:hypothetical protein OROMI_030622 [Orobanche minor]